MPQPSRRRKRPLYWQFVWMLIYFFLAASVFGLIASMPVWQIKQIVVEGNSLLLSKDIIKTAKVPIGENIFFIGFGRPTRRVMDIIQIKEASMYRRFPDTVVIKVKERQPFATTVIDSNPVIVDGEGIIIWSSRPIKGLFGKKNFIIDTSAFPDLPLVGGLTSKDIKDNYKVSPHVFKAVSSAFEELRKFMPVSKLSFEMKGLDQIDLLVDDVLRIKIGSSKDIDRKVETFRALVDSLKHKVNLIEYVDVRLPDKPAIKFKS